MNPRRVASLGAAGMNPIVNAIGSIGGHMMDFPRQTAVVPSGYHQLILNPATIPDLAWVAVEEVLKLERYAARRTIIEIRDLRQLKAKAVVVSLLALRAAKAEATGRPEAIRLGSASARTETGKK